MKLWYSGHEYYENNYLPIKRIKTNEINNYFDDNFGFNRIILLS